MDEATRRKSTNMFKNLTVGFVYRRLVDDAINILDLLKVSTQRFARGAYEECDWVQVWQDSVSKVALWNVQQQQDMADDFLATQDSDFMAALDVTYETYVACNFGKTADGRVNLVYFDDPPFHEFYHAFLTQLMQEPSVKFTRVFENMVRDIYGVVERAFLDALRAVFRGRVTVKETRTKEERRAIRNESRGRALGEPKPPAATPRIAAAAATAATAAPAAPASVASAVDSGCVSVIRAWEGGLERKPHRSAFVPVSSSRDTLRPDDSVTQITATTRPVSAVSAATNTASRSDIRVLPPRPAARKAVQECSKPGSPKSSEVTAATKATDASSSLARSVVY